VGKRQPLTLLIERAVMSVSLTHFVSTCTVRPGQSNATTSARRPGGTLVQSCVELDGADISRAIERERRHRVADLMRDERLDVSGFADLEEPAAQRGSAQLTSPLDR